MIDELHAIAERVARKEAFAPAERSLLDDIVPGIRQADPQFMKIRDSERDMRLSSGPEVRINADVQLPIAELEPATAAPLHFLGFGYFG